MEKKQQSCEAFEWIESIAFALVFTLLVLVFVLNFSRVSGHSMVSTLEDGDRVLVQTAFYTPKRGDVITTDALIDYGKPLAKRVIALAGDVINIDAATGAVSVNGTTLNEPYIIAPTQPADVPLPLTVPDGKAFVMGDNRPGSSDSRYDVIGCIDTRDIMGRIVYRVSPTSAMGSIK